MKYLLIILLATFGTSCKNYNSITAQTTLKMNTNEFHQWVQDTRIKCEKENTHPYVLRDNLLERLAQDIYSLDSSVISVVNALYGYESHKNGTGKEQFSGTIELIDTILPMLYDRVLLKSNLLLLKGDILNFIRLEDQAKIEYDKSISLLEPMHLEVDRKRIQSMLSLAELSLLSNNQIEKAENLYLDILSYPWTLTEDPEYFQIFLDYYLQAGKGLIECRKDDLEGLKNVFFVPATHEYLMPILNKAIEEATNK